MNVKKIEKIHMDSQKSLNSFEMKNRACRMIIYEKLFFYQFVKNFAALFLCEINVLDIFDMGDFFKFLLYREILKF